MKYMFAMLDMSDVYKRGEDLFLLIINGTLLFLRKIYLS